MAWRFVRQPNGSLARWSDIVDDFIDTHMTPGEAVDIAIGEGMAFPAAAEKVRRALDDEDTRGRGECGDGLSRWRECLIGIGAVHGADRVKEREEACARRGLGKEPRS